MTTNTEEIVEIFLSNRTSIEGLLQFVWKTCFSADERLVHDFVLEKPDLIKILGEYCENVGDLRCFERKETFPFGKLNDSLKEFDKKLPAYRDRNYDWRNAIQRALRPRMFQYAFSENINKIYSYPIFNDTQTVSSICMKILKQNIVFMARKHLAVYKKRYEIAQEKIKANTGSQEEIEIAKQQAEQAIEDAKITQNLIKEKENNLYISKVTAQSKHFNSGDEDVRSRNLEHVGLISLFIIYADK